jgi:hypothetical protein
MKMWISKYALTKGVYEASGKIVGDYFYPELEYISCRIGKEVHKTRKQAIVAAEKTRTKKLASLEKQLAALKELTF